MIPYGRQWIDEDDVDAVVEALRSDWLTTGPAVDAFESDLATVCGCAYAVAVSSGTAALHAAVASADVGPGDEVIVPAMTFAATANVAVFQQATPVFADVQPGTLLIDPDHVEQLVTSRTKAIMAVDYTGHPCDYDALRSIAEKYGLALIADASHSLGATYKGRRVGELADATTLSFHPVKHITTGEGGAMLTDDEAIAAKARSFRNHGITVDHRARSLASDWVYSIMSPGLNYRLTDIQSALGRSQLRKLSPFLKRRREIAAAYDVAFADLEGVSPLEVMPDVEHAYHLYVVRVAERDRAFALYRERGVGVNVHYIPTHLLDVYRERFGTSQGDCPRAEAAYGEILSLPIYPAMDDVTVDRVIEVVEEVWRLTS